METCPYCGNRLNGTNPNFCDYCQKSVPDTGSTVQGDFPDNVVQTEGTEKDHDSLGPLDRCPACGKFFAGKVVKKEETDSNDILTKEKQPALTSGAYFSRPRVGILPLSPTDYVYKTTRFTYQCKHCQFQWTRDKTDRIAIHTQDKAEDRQYWNKRD